MHPRPDQQATTRPDQFQSLRDASARAFADTPVLFAYLFGSTAAGRARPGSDVDVAVYLDASADRADYLGLQLRLAGRLEDAARRSDVDLLILNEAPLRLQGRIVQERVVLYSRDEPARVRYESLTMRMYLDFEIHARPLDRQFLRDIAEGRR